MKDRKEVEGTLLGFDSLINMVLEGVVEQEATPEGLQVTRLQSILLNGSNVAVIVPGGKPPEYRAAEKLPDSD